MASWTDPPQDDHWIVDDLDNIDGTTSMFFVEKYLYRGTTEFHEITIFTNPGYGRILMLDDL